MGADGWPGSDAVLALSNVTAGTCFLPSASNHLILLLFGHTASISQLENEW